MKELLLQLMQSLNLEMEVEKDGVKTVWVWDYFREKAINKDKMTREDILKSEIYKNSPNG